MTLGFSLKQDKFWDCCSHLNWADSRVDLCSDTFSYEVHIKFICSLCSQFFSHMFSRIWFTCSTPSFQSTADEKFRLFVIIDCRSGSGKIWEDLGRSGQFGHSLRFMFPHEFTQSSAHYRVLPFGNFGTPFRCRCSLSFKSLST